MTSARVVTIFSTKLLLTFKICEPGGWSSSSSHISHCAYYLQHSVVRFNALVDLEEEYAAYRRKVVDGFEDLQKINQEISQHLRQIIQDHDRHTLSKKFPITLSSPLPSILLNPTTVLSR